MKTDCPISSTECARKQRFRERVWVRENLPLQSSGLDFLVLGSIIAVSVLT
ncbi:hypothetical protein KHP62_10135 [Rhodobacteraceae bacterium NNCM2]|nr:hypothetical protein [Coraliihabitans acroporae]